MSHTPSAAGALQETVFVTDFELARNAEGEWLLIVPDLPDTLTDNPLAASGMEAELDGDTLVITSPVISLHFKSLIAAQYAKALNADRPREILLCIVDDDGLRRYGQLVPFKG